MTKRNGEVVGAKTVTDQDEVMLISQEGMMVRCPVKDVRATGRAAQGVRIINIKGKDRLAAVASVVPKEKEEQEEPPTGEPKQATPEPSAPPAAEAAPSKPKAAAKPTSRAAKAKKKR